jgi:hypothetical protein
MWMTRKKSIKSIDTSTCNRNQDPRGQRRGPPQREEGDVIRIKGVYKMTSPEEEEEEEEELDGMGPK